MRGPMQDLGAGHNARLESFESRFFVDDVTIRVGFAFLDDVFCRPNEPISWLKVLLDSRL